MFSKLDSMIVMMKLQMGAVLTSVEDLLTGKNAEIPESLSPIEKLIVNYGSGLMNLGNMAFVYIVGLCVLASAAAMVIHNKNHQKKAEIKDGLPWILGGAVVGFCIVGIIKFIQTIALGLLPS